MSNSEPVSESAVPNPPIVHRDATLALHPWHSSRSAHFELWNGREVVSHYGNPAAEYRAVREATGMFDLSARGRLCLLGTDRVRFLHGQVTNDVRGLKPGFGTYAALVNAKGKMESDLRIYVLEDELLLDLEPGFDVAVASRLEKYVISEEVQIVDASPYYGMLSLQGPLSGQVLAEWAGGENLLPSAERRIVALEREEDGKCYFAMEKRLGNTGYDIYVPSARLTAAADALVELVLQAGGSPCGMKAWEAARLGACIPRYGVDLDSSTLPPEAGLENMAISYSKGCYIGQEVIARIRTYGQVARQLRGFRISGSEFPGDPTTMCLFSEAREVGRITTLEDTQVTGTAGNERIAMGYVRKEFKDPGTVLQWVAGARSGAAVVACLPFQDV